MSMWNSKPSTLASRDKVASDGSWSPEVRNVPTSAPVPAS